MGRRRPLSAGGRIRTRALALATAAAAVASACASGAGNTHRAGLAGADDLAPPAAQRRGADAGSAVGSSEYAVAAPWRAAGGAIRYGSRAVRLQGTSWFGLETPDRAPHGLWAGRRVDDVMRQVRALGLTALRLPVSPEVIRPGHPTAAWAQRRGYPADGHAGLRYVFAAARRAGLAVVVAFHTYDPARLGPRLPGRPDEPASGRYTADDWLADLRALARLAMEYPNVAGVDLLNEPHALTWDEWAALAERGGRTVVDANDRVLVFVEGVGNVPTPRAAPATGPHNAEHWAFWGENLSGALGRPVRAAFVPADRLVYSPHVYGPAGADMPYFHAVTYPDNLPAVWDAHFGRLAAAGHTLVVGEFGGAADGPGRAWHAAFAAYVRARGVRHWFYWALNPNSGDVPGLLRDDWRTVDPARWALLQRLIAAP